MSFSTCDLCDDNEQALACGSIVALPPIFHHYGGKQQFFGPATTLKVFEDNGIVRATLETEGHGRVLVIDGGGSLRCALVGGNLAALAVANHWAGIIVHGCIRDVNEIKQAAVGVCALGSMPVKSIKHGIGLRDLRIVIGGVAIHSGHWIYADADGILVSNDALF